MQATEPTPSTDVQPSVAETEPRASETSEPQVSENWFQRLFRRERGIVEEPEPQAEPEQPPTRTMTEEEFQRAVQAETDRRESKRARDAEAAERNRLRDEDPWEYVSQEKQREDAQKADARLNEMLQGIGQAHDQVTLLPLMETLPKAERDRLMALPGAGVGGDGRKLLTTEALKSLEKIWKEQGAQEAEAKLRKDPVFRKKVMSEFAGAYPEPEVVLPGAATSNGHRDVNSMLRRQIGLPTE